MNKNSIIICNSLVSAGYIDVNKELPTAGELVNVVYLAGSIDRDIIIEKGKINERGRWTGETDWKSAIFWKPV
jgi:hypothetical protein